TTATAKLKPGVSIPEIRAAWEEAYADKQFIHVLPEGQWPSTKSVLGYNHVTMKLAVDESAGRVFVVDAFEYLTKGTAGGAVQSMNIALGFPEETGLTTQGVAP